MLVFNIKIRYFDTIVRAWLNNGILTVEKAKEQYQRAKEGKAREQNRGNSGKYEETQPRKSKYHIPTFIDGVEQPL
jgi:DNA replication protein DnaD